MLITFKCPGCQQSLEIDSVATGQQVPCPSCGGSVAVPRKGIGPGTTLGGFKIERKLGQGGMGEVYLARQLSLDRLVALKILPASMGLDKDFSQRFLNEMRLLAQLDHPHIVTAHEAGEDGGVDYLAMAYVKGESLEDRLKRTGPMAEKPALEIVRKIGSALQYAWDKHQLLHRDVKPANILLDEGEEPKLVDLGLAKSLQAKALLTINTSIMGTPNYMSPEQVMGEADLDYRADIYSLGMTLYHMVTGQVPFGGSSVMETLKKQMSESLPDPREINPALSEGLVTLLETMLTKQKAERPASWEVLLADIKRLLMGKALAKDPLPLGSSVMVRRKQLHVPVGGLKAAAAAVPQKQERSLLMPLVAAVALLLVAGIGIGVSLKVRGAKAAAARQAAAETAKANAAAEQAKKQQQTLAEAAAAAQRLKAAHEKAVSIEVARLRNDANAALDKGEFATALAGVETYYGAFTGETAAVRAELALLARTKQLESEKAKAAAVREAETAKPEAQAASQAETGRAKLTAWTDSVAADLLSGNLAAAAAKVSAAEAEDWPKTVPDEWRETGEVVRKAAAVQSVILESFRADVGKSVAVEFKKGWQTLSIVAVRAARIEAQIRVEGASVDRPFEVSDLSLQEKCNRLGKTDTPVVQLMRGCLLKEAGKAAEATKCFLAGGVVGQAMVATLERRQREATELAARKAYDDVLAAAGLASGKTNADLTSAIRRKKFNDTELAKTKQAVAGFLEEYRQTAVATSNADVLAILETSNGHPLVVDEAAVEKAIEALKKANPRQTSLRSSFRVTESGVDLNISMNQDLSDISALKGLPLRTLDAQGTKVGQIDALRDMPLEELDLGSCTVEDHEPLKGMRLRIAKLGRGYMRDTGILGGMPLESLSVYCRGNLTFLSGMPLKVLSLTADNRLVDLKPLSTLPLTELNLYFYNGPDLGGLKGCALREVFLYDCAELSDIGALRGMPLKDVYISKCPKLGSLQGLEGATNLSAVTLQGGSGDRGVDVDLSHLEGLPVRSLMLLGIPVKSLKVLPTLTRLHKLVIDRCPDLKDVTPLADCKRLETLSISGDSVADLGRLRNHPTLMRISAAGKTNQLSADFWKDYDARKK